MLVEALGGVDQFARFPADVKEEIYAWNPGKNFEVKYRDGYSSANCVRLLIHYRICFMYPGASTEVLSDAKGPNTR